MTFTRFVPLQMKRRGVAMRLVIGDGISFTREIAEREEVNERFVRRLIPLAFLSPAIVQTIAEGRQRADLTGEALSRSIDIPVEWAKQNTALGFE